jgi:GxxExxY protein
MGTRDAISGSWVEPDSLINELAHKVIGAALEVHRVLGPGFVESVYEEALSLELQSHGIPFARQPLVSVSYKGHVVGQGRLDILVTDALVVELKAVESLLPIHGVQLLSYLKATGYKLGLLINFNAQYLKNGIRRIVHTQH